jgi:hypothetical protein
MMQIQQPACKAIQLHTYQLCPLHRGRIDLPAGQHIKAARHGQSVEYVARDRGSRLQESVSSDWYLEWTRLKKDGTALVDRPLSKESVNLIVNGTVVDPMNDDLAACLGGINSWRSYTLSLNCTRVSCLVR